MTIEELEVISESVENIVKIKAINALLEAINDWPVEIETVDDYFKESLAHLTPDPLTHPITPITILLFDAI